MPAALMDRATHSGSRPKAIVVKPDVDIICQNADHRGLPNSALSSLLDLLTSPHKLEQSSQNALLMSFYPSQKISDDLVRTIISSLGAGKRKASTSTQQGLLKWLVMVYDLVENRAVFSRLYSVLFNLLNVFYLRTQLSHLLLKITQRKHVKPFRIAMLQGLGFGITKDANIIKLIKLFESFAPGSMDIQTAGLVVTVQHPDPQWAKTLHRIWLGNGKILPKETLPSDKISFGGQGSRSTEAIVREDQAYRFSNLEGLDDILKHFENMKIDSLTLSDLGDPLLRQYLIMRPEDLNDKQVDKCLARLLARYKERIEEDDGGLRRELFENILAYTQFSE
ncbi:MAG: hypothetical protein Q9164_003230, partial [Protoblastenia rupestris]